jgi:iron complex transport system permease protein
VLWSIRLPRIAIASMVGALLAVAGDIMQGLFRNPLADPALVGVSSGGALAATTTIVIGDRLGWPLPFELLPIAAFIGALSATTALHGIATRESRTSAAIFLLGGLAIAALANAGIGLLVLSLTIGSCATSRSGCWARLAAQPGPRLSRSRPSQPCSSSPCR